MKRYWQLIIIVSIIVASVGTFYIQSALATKKLPQISIKKLSGDEQEIESLIISGEYQDETSMRGEVVNLGLDGALYWSETSFFEQINGSYLSHEIKQLQKEHRNFMRGKYDLDSLFENDEQVAYVDMTYKYDLGVSNKLIISVLNKMTNKTVSFDHMIQSNEADGWIDVMKVQIMDGQLKVLTKNEVRSNNNYENWEIHVYTFDLAKKTLENDEVIQTITDEAGENGYMDIEALQSSGGEESSDVAFIKTITTWYTDEEYTDEKNAEEYMEEEMMDESVEQTLIIYDLVKNEIKETNMDEMTKYGYPSHFDGSNIYFVEVDSDKGVELNAYNLESNKVIDTFVIDQPEGFHGPETVLKDGKLFLINSYMSPATPAFITVVDIETKETLYQGEILIEDQKDTDGIFEFYLYDVGFK